MKHASRINLLGAVLLSFLAAGTVLAQSQTITVTQGGAAVFTGAAMCTSSLFPSNFISQPSTGTQTGGSTTTPGSGSSTTTPGTGSTTTPGTGSTTTPGTG